MPPYRPANRNLDQSVRRIYRTNGERTFIRIMFTGVLLEAVSRACHTKRDKGVTGDRPQRNGGELLAAKSLIEFSDTGLVVNSE